jgi:geranylgeranyl pyrophosphate synthase
MTTPAAQITPVKAAADRLMRELTMDVPGELGRMVRAMVGVNAGEDATINPPAEPIRWATSLLELCCRVYGAPTERAVPVGACLALLGIASSALDAAQDDHQDLLSSYGAGWPFASDHGREDLRLGVAGPELDMARGGTRRGAGTTRFALTANASTALIGMAWQALLAHGPRYGVEAQTLVEIGQLIAERLVIVCAAQHRDLTVGRTARLSLEQYDEIIAGKTGQIDGTACEVGALLVGAAHHRELWRTLGAERAAAQQLYDDHKDFKADLLQGGQISHAVLYGLAVADAAQRATILTLLEQARSGTTGSQAAVGELTALLQELGAEYYTLTAMVMHRNRALAALDCMRLPSAAHEHLYEWVMRVAPRLG